ncbi:hypothetical protein BDV93DRAFT_579402 [Ceratobasidium sp. AG-I]|nr:hypothetical protein BDV93DRAFT_579402 [Ceratobasidium sp. AG-I]
MPKSVAGFWRLFNVWASTSQSPLTINTQFNYHSPAYELVKRSLAGGKVGKVLSVHSKCLLDTFHVAGQFRRWNRQKTSSGSLWSTNPVTTLTPSIGA